MKNLDMSLIWRMAHSPLHNYVVPGLTSWLIGNPSPNGVVRMFESTRNQEEAITPHSHRFDLHCQVIAGHVENRIWSETESEDEDFYQLASLTYSNTPGVYDIKAERISRWETESYYYSAGGSYSMAADEIHSIRFERNTLVLFFEGPTVSSTSFCLEPVVAGEVIHTLKTEPWMFKK